MIKDSIIVNNRCGRIAHCVDSVPPCPNRRPRQRGLCSFFFTAMQQGCFAQVGSTKWLGQVLTPSRSREGSVRKFFEIVVKSPMFAVWIGSAWSSCHVDLQATR